MAMFMINGDGDIGTKRTVDAARYEIADGFVHFMNESKQRVLSLMAAQVYTIERFPDGDIGHRSTKTKN